jgi:hypothetical protein
MTTLITWPPSSRSLVEGHHPPRRGGANNVDSLRCHPPVVWQLALDVGPFDRSMRLAEELDARGGCGEGDLTCC